MRPVARVTFITILVLALSPVRAMAADVEQWIQDLASPDETTRQNACARLAEKGRDAKAAIPALLKVAQENRRYTIQEAMGPTTAARKAYLETRARAVEALGRVGADATPETAAVVMPALLGLYESPIPPKVLDATVVSFGDAAYAHLTAALDTGNSYDKLVPLRLLTRFPRRSARTAQLAIAALADKDALVVRAAVDVLAYLRTMDPVAVRPAAPTLFGLMNDPERRKPVPRERTMKDFGSAQPLGSQNEVLYAARLAIAIDPNAPELRPALQELLRSVRSQSRDARRDVDRRLLEDAELELRGLVDLLNHGKVAPVDPTVSARLTTESWMRNLGALKEPSTDPFSTWDSTLRAFARLLPECSELDRNAFLRRIVAKAPPEFVEALVHQVGQGPHRAAFVQSLGQIEDCHRFLRFLGPVPPETLPPPP